VPRRTSTYCSSASAGSGSKVEKSAAQCPPLSSNRRAMFVPPRGRLGSAAGNLRARRPRGAASACRRTGRSAQTASNRSGGLQQQRRLGAATLACCPPAMRLASAAVATEAQPGGGVELVHVFAHEVGAVRQMVLALVFATRGRQAREPPANRGRPKRRHELVAAQEVEQVRSRGRVEGRRRPRVEREARARVERRQVAPRLAPGGPSARAGGGGGWGV